MAARRVAVIGAATSAGSHHAGQERAPAALRAAGFVTRLADAGLDVTDAGDVVTAPVVHFDVDAVDSADLPLANFPHYGLGVPLAVAAGVLPVFYRMPRLLAAVFTEVNPSYEPSGAALARYVDATAGALTAALASHADLTR